MSDGLPAISEKPSLLDYLEQFLPFKIPRIPLPQTATNLDKAAAKIVLAGGANLEARLSASTSRVRHQSKAEAKFIDAGSAAAVELIGVDPALSERAIEYALGEVVTGQRNRERILEIAVEELDEVKNDAVTEIDDDWLNMFAEIAKQKGNADIQTLWGKILAGEIRAPGTFSLRTLLHLSTLTTDEANFVYGLMPLVVNSDFIAKDGKFLSVENSLRLQELHVISGTGTSLSTVFHLSPNNESQARNYNLLVNAVSTIERKVTVPAAQLTQFGKELHKLCAGIVANKEYVEALARRFVDANTKVQIFELGEEQGEGPFQILSRSDVT